MPKVISFISRKGGTGKTTNAINIATSLVEMGFEVVLIETDPNYSLQEVRQNELKKMQDGGEMKFPELVQTEEIGVVKLIKTYQKSGEFDFIIVDSAANTSSYGTNRISVHSDAVFIPTSLSMNDVMVAQRTLKDILPASLDENPALKVALLANRIHILSAHETVQKALEHLQVPVLDIYIPNLKTYTFISTVKPAEGYKEVANAVLKFLVPQQVEEYSY